MKKKYCSPKTAVLLLDFESCILAESDITIGTDETEANGTEALSLKKNLWGRENVWE